MQRKSGNSSILLDILDIWNFSQISKPLPDRTSRRKKKTQATDWEWGEQQTEFDVKKTRFQQYQH
jgi:hypothetical protein